MRKLGAAVTFSALAALIPFVGQAPASAASWSRIAGADRIETSVLLAARSFPTTSGVVFLARFDDPADALAAGTLTNGPVLLVPRCGDLPGIVTQAITRLAPKQIVALGGELAICSATLAQAAGGRPTTRLGGGSRYETAVKISEYQFQTGSRQVMLAQATNSPDALLAGTMNIGPVLLVPSTGTLPAVVLNEISRLQPARVVAIGGRSSISDAMLMAAAGTRPFDRLFGTSRYATSAAVSLQQFSTLTGSKAAYLVNAENFTDAIAAGPLVDGPILLVPACGTLPAEIAAELRRLHPPTVVALGGPGRVCNGLILQAMVAAG